MHLRRTTALLVGALLIAAPALSSCSITGRDAATNRDDNPITTGASNRDAQVDVLNAVVVSKANGSGTFIATLVNNSADADDTLASLSGASVEVKEFTPVKVPVRGMVNLADGQGITVTGDFSAGQYLGFTVGLGSGESVDLNVPVVADAGYFSGLDTSSS
ncbi:MAG: hypothetical protein U0R80_02670 [Nocardioidaceae bacterium]